MKPLFLLSLFIPCVCFAQYYPTFSEQAPARYLYQNDPESKKRYMEDVEQYIAKAEKYIRETEQHIQTLNRAKEDAVNKLKQVEFDYRYSNWR